MVNDRCQWKPPKYCQQYVLATWTRYVWDKETDAVPCGVFYEFCPTSPQNHAYSYESSNGDGSRQMTMLIVYVDRKLANEEMAPVESYALRSPSPCRQWPPEITKCGYIDAVNPCVDGGESCG